LPKINETVMKKLPGRNEIEMKGLPGGNEKFCLKEMKQ
jgi:hypothetical protein